MIAEFEWCLLCEARSHAGPKLVTWHVVRTIIHLDRTALSASTALKPEEWGRQATPVTPTATMGEYQQPTRRFKCTLQHQCAILLNSFRLVDWLFFGFEVRVPFKGLKHADGNVERCLVLKIWMIALRSLWLHLLCALAVPPGCKSHLALREATSSHHKLPWLSAEQVQR